MDKLIKIGKISIFIAIVWYFPILTILGFLTIIFFTIIILGINSYQKVYNDIFGSPTESTIEFIQQCNKLTNEDIDSWLKNMYKYDIFSRKIGLYFIEQIKENYFGNYKNNYDNNIEYEEYTESNRPREICYQIFEIIDYNYSTSTIKNKYKELVKKYHPDLYHDKSDQEKKEAEEMFKKINDCKSKLLEDLSTKNKYK